MLPSLLRLIPERELEFPYQMHPCTPVTQILRLQNVAATKSFVAFKIKTTAPKHYLVRPCQGVIPSGQTCDIQITLQPTPDNETATSDRFMVQATTVSSSEIPKDFWNTVTRSDVQDQRLNVAFVGSGKPSRSGANSSAEQGDGGAMMKSTVSLEGSPASVGGGPGRTPGPVGGGADKYSELVNYCLAVERENYSLKKEVEAFNSKSRNMAVNAAGGRTWVEAWHIVPLVVAILLLAKLFGFL